MIKSYLLSITAIMLVAFTLQAQVYETFDDGNLSSEWIGDTENFFVNDNLQLQLNDTEGGSSKIFIASSFTQDFTWKAEIELKFSPSSSNKLSYFLMLDEFDEQERSGYSFEIGEDGTSDALIFYRWDFGTKIEIARGMEATLGSSPAQVNLQIDRINGKWTILTNYNQSSFLTEEFSFLEDTYQFENGYLGLQCDYTSTRKDKFYFDNIVADEYAPDQDGPVVTELERIDNQRFLIYFNEFLDESAASNANITIDPFIELESISSTNNPTNALEIVFSEELESGPDYTLSISGITDLLGNVMNDTTFTFFVTGQADKGDILVNEVLFNPYKDNYDFIELYNNSDKIIDLIDYSLVNHEKEETKYIDESILLKPHQYVALTLDKSLLENTYQVPDTAYIANASIPSLNVASGNITLYNAESEMIDSMVYTEDWHYQLIEDTKGISLERISFNAPTLSESNWFSGSSSTNFATPGYENTNALKEVEVDEEETIQIGNKTFSPNQDGQDDYLLIGINASFYGTVGTIEIYDIYGNVKRTLVNNALISTNDQFRWDGLDDDNNPCNMGHYIVYFSGYNEEGKTVDHKVVVRLVDFI